MSDCQHIDTHNVDRIEREEWHIDRICSDCGVTLASMESILPLTMERQR